MRNRQLFPLATLFFLLTQSSFNTATASSLPSGSGAPLYGIYTDLKQNTKTGTWSSSAWLSTLSNQQASTHLKYIYPNYPYINYLAFEDPDNWSTFPISDLYNTDCKSSNTWPVFFDYNVRTPEITNADGTITKSACYASGATANTVYRNGKQFLILPQFSMDGGLTQAITNCYTAFANKATSCTIPCASTADGSNPVFARTANTCDPTTDLMKITSTTQLDNMLSYTGKLIANQVAADTSTDGVSFDIEGPALPDEGALSFYSGLVNQLQALKSSKYIGVWEGVNVFKNTQNQTTLLQKVLAPNNGFLIISMYDIGPDNTSPSPGIQDGGGLEVGQWPSWYAGLSVPQSQVPKGSQLSAFELSLFGLSSQSDQCNPTDMYFNSSAKITGFNGCAGSIGFMRRMMGTQGNSPLPKGMPFQIGIPAMASTTEWVYAVMFYNKLDSTFIPGTQPIDFSKVAVGVSPVPGWITPVPIQCPFTIPSANPKTTSVTCIVFQLNNGLANTQSQFLANPVITKIDGTHDGALNIIYNRAIKNATDNWNGNFLGFYIYGIKDSQFDVNNCNTYFTKHTTGGCYGNYPELNAQGQYTNTIPSSVWAAISSFYSASTKDVKKTKAKTKTKDHKK